MARRYHSGYFGFADKEKYLDALFLDEIPGEEERKGDPEGRNNLLKPYREAWRQNKHRLLARVTTEVLFDDCERHRMIQKTIEMLHHLRVPVVHEINVPNIR